MGGRKERARTRRLAREAELRAQARRKRRLASLTAAVAAIVLVGGAVVATGGGTDHTDPVASPPVGAHARVATLGNLKPAGPTGVIGPEGVSTPDASQLAGGASGSGGSRVDGIGCQGGEQVLFHIHAHLTVFVNGAARRIPYGIGIPGAQVTATPAGPFVAAGACFYWLHTHAADGIIHVESPVVRAYSLGDFFDVWGQKLGPTVVGPAHGAVTALYNGRVFRGNPRDVPLTRHAQIQLDVGRPLIAPVTIAFPPGL